jgi:hypothetical protein
MPVSRSRISPTRHPAHAALVLLASLCAIPGAAAKQPPESYEKKVLPLLERYCYDCHGEGIKKGGVTLDSHRSPQALLADHDLWSRIRDQLDFRLMPPPDEDAPQDVERDQLISWIDDTIFPVDPANPDPGRVTLRRLNRSEYRNTIRDLLGVDLNVDAILPPDDTGYGFDNIGDTLTLSPAHLERYFDAAEQALELAIRIGPMPREQQVATGSRLRGDGQPRDDGRFLFTSGEASTRFDVLRTGRYRVEITAGGSPGGDTDPHMELRIDHQPAHAWDVSAPEAKPEVHTHELEIKETGRLRVAAAFTNDFYDESIEDEARQDRNLLVRSIALIGPLDGPAPAKPPAHRRIYGEDRSSRPEESDAAYAGRVIGNFALRAFRRPPTAEELRRHRDLALRQADGDIERGIRDALLAILVSPSFIYREEAPSPGQDADGMKSLVSEHALASRLSYFLWSSMPDDRLLELATAGTLRQNLRGEVTRMLASEKSAALVTDFAGQWLQTRDLDIIAPDAKAFPQFDRALATAMRGETEQLVTHIIRENLPVRTLIDADFTFLNDRLARHYGYEELSGSHFRKVSLKDTPRRGILGHASILTLTSYPTRTSPVIRGKYILDNILNTPPPPPPQNVPALETTRKDGENLALREQLERHRADPNCSSCHALMDPLGFGLENFDAIGRWRDKENGHPIDPAGTLADGQSFAGPAELLEILTQDPKDRFLRASAAKMLTFALGRGLEYYDRPALDSIVSRAKENDGRIHSLIHAIVESVPFQYRRNAP